MEFRATVIPPGNALGIEVAGVRRRRRQGGRPPVVVTIDGHTWRTRVAAMRGQLLIGINGANRAASRIDAREEIVVHLELDDQPRQVEAPADLAAMLDTEPDLRSAYDWMPFGLKRKR